MPEPRLRHFDAELDDLKNQLLEMGALVASSVHRSILALTEKSEDLAHQVLRDEARVDAMEIQIDDAATRLIATQQPVARDMRLIVVAIKINTELERMGDLAANITERSLATMHLPAVSGELNSDIKELSLIVEHMVLSVLDAFVKQDEEAARNIIASDDSVDRLRTKIGDALIERMQKDPEVIPRALSLMFNSRSLERISDHATNIAEEVIFLVKGIDVRHRYGSYRDAAENGAEASDSATLNG
jgi:phosphate transport system protein